MADDSQDGKASAGRPKLGKVVARATTSPVNLGVAGAGVIAAAALGSWPILALGGVAYAALVAFDSASPAFWKKTFASGGREPAKLPAPDKIKDEASRAAITRLAAVRAELARVLRETPADVRANLATVEVGLDDLEDHAARLVARAEELARYLVRVDGNAIRDDVARLDAQVARARDPQARAQLEKAKAARVDELRTLEELENAKQRLDANLLRVVAVVGGLPSKVVHMRTLDAQAMDDVSGDINAEVERLSSEMRTFEETLKTLVEDPTS
jgi:hypothetical protein